MGDFRIGDPMDKTLRHPELLAATSIEPYIDPVLVAKAAELDKIVSALC